MDVYAAIDTIDEATRKEDSEIVLGLQKASQDVTAKIADGLSRLDKRMGRNLLYDAIGLVAIVRTQLAIAWGRGLMDDNTFRAIDTKYDELAVSLQK
jgi:four helix bundle protein